MGKVLPVSCLLAILCLLLASPLNANLLEEPSQSLFPETRPLRLFNSSDFDDHLSDFLKNDPRKLAILLDFDGTLGHITPHPNDTLILPQVDKYLRKLATREDVFIALISGRGLSDLNDKVTVPGLVRGGNHGLEISFPDGEFFTFPLSEDLQRNYSKIFDQIKDQLTVHDAWVEGKRMSLTYHLEMTPEEHQKELRERASEIIEANGFLAKQALRLVDAKPPVQWHKGYAAEHILTRTFGKKWRKLVKVVMAGDDNTDEDVMRVLKGQGAVFRVSLDDQVDTSANYLVDAPEQVGELLKWIWEHL